MTISTDTRSHDNDYFRNTLLSSSSIISDNFNVFEQDLKNRFKLSKMPPVFLKYIQ